MIFFEYTVFGINLKARRLSRCRNLQGDGGPPLQFRLAVYRSPNLARSFPHVLEAVVEFKLLIRSETNPVVNDAHHHSRRFENNFDLHLSGFGVLHDVGQRLLEN